MKLLPKPKARLQVEDDDENIGADAQVAAGETRCVMRVSIHTRFTKASLYFEQADTQCHAAAAAEEECEGMFSSHRSFGVASTAHAALWSASIERDETRRERNVLSIINSGTYGYRGAP